MTITFKGLAAGLAAALLSVAGCAATGGAATTPQAPETDNQQAVTRTVVDLTGREVTIPEQVTKVANLLHNSREPTIMLKATDQVVVTSSAPDYWTSVVDPAYGQIERVENGREPNVVQLVENGVEVAFFWDSVPEATAKMEEAGIAVIYPTPTGIDTPEEFLAAKQHEVMLYGEVYGGEAVAKAEQWRDYAEAAFEEIYSRTKDIPVEDRPTVYYVRGPEALRIHGGASITRYLVEIAGGDLVSKVDDLALYETTMEQAIAWDPEYIIMGRVGNTELITDDPAWESVQAVKDANVYVNLKAIGPTDYSTTGLLMMQQLATILHPDLFADIDMVAKTKDYFATFYDYEITDAQAEEVLTFAHTD
ncbi:MAG: ABC transporter substrate-binding protein [Propioniciclava sp.]